MNSQVHHKEEERKRNKSKNMFTVLTLITEIISFLVFEIYNMVTIFPREGWGGVRIISRFV